MGSHYIQNQAAPARRVGGQLAVITPRTAHVHRLNGLGTFLWEHCATPGKTFEMLVSAVVENYEVDDDQARRDTEGFLNDAVEKGVLLRIEG